MSVSVVGDVSCQSLGPPAILSSLSPVCSFSLFLSGPDMHQKTQPY